MNLSPHFTLEEAILSATASRKGINNMPSLEVIENMKITAKKMEAVRALLGNPPIHITSWFRCLKLNRAIGSMDTSGHVNGWAVDFIAPTFGSPDKVCNLIHLAGVKFDQLIYEGTWTHISFAPQMRGMVLTASFNKIGKATYLQGIHSK